MALENRNHGTGTIGSSSLASSLGVAPRHRGPPTLRRPQQSTYQASISSPDIARDVLNFLGVVVSVVTCVAETAPTSLKFPTAPPPPPMPWVIHRDTTTSGLAILSTHPLTRKIAGAQSSALVKAIEPCLAGDPRGWLKSILDPTRLELLVFVVVLIFQLRRRSVQRRASAFVIVGVAPTVVARTADRRAKPVVRTSGAASRCHDPTFSVV